MSLPVKPLSDKQALTGIVLLIVSYLIFLLSIVNVAEDGTLFGLFAINYAFSITYFIVLCFKRRFSFKPGNMLPMAIFLVMLLLSAWSLNRTLPVFEESVPWLNICLVITSIGYMLAAAATNNTLRHISLFTVGIGSCLFLYLAIYLTPIYPLSAIGLLALGISIHAFVPVLFIIYTIVLLLRLSRQSSRYAISYAAGVAASIFAVTFFSVKWSAINKQVTETLHSYLLQEDADVPAWVTIASALPKSNISEKYLKADLVYTTPSEHFSFSMPSRNFDEVRKHDPLIMIACLLNKRPSINEQDRIKILECMYDARDKTQERLWSGKDLRTDNIVTNVRIWPKLRIAYTEKTITVQSDHNTGGTWQQRHEGIYTFHLPEGSIVTSLSLWIDGREQKGILTTKSKADSAYKTIVGVEQRDPSVIHWQEGNTVSVRVFPIMSHDNRMFKIGITSPLTYSAGQLTYQNVYFSGPSASNAMETVQVDWVDMPGGYKMPDGYKPKGVNRYVKTGNYDPYWQIQFKDEGIAGNGFTFDGHNYSIAPYTPYRTPANFTTAYMDVNRTWTKQEFEAAFAACKARKVFVYDDRFIELTTSNINDVFQQLSQRNFTIFPFHRLSDPSHSLVISKSNTLSPNVADLEKTELGAALQSKLAKGDRFNLFSLGPVSSPYLKTLKEHRVFRYEQGDVQQLQELLNKNTFAANVESDSLIVVHNAAIQIQRRAANSSTATVWPDHAMRIFAYNHIMQRSAGSLFGNMEADSMLVREADQAYVVSPLSSLIVLETQKDYDRFDIKRSKNSLGNASMKGAVPEPHEWALIALLVAATLLYLYKHQRSKKTVRV